MAQRFADGQPGDRHDRVVEVRHQLGPARAGDVRDRLGLDCQVQQLEHGVDAAFRLRVGRADLEESCGVLLDHARLEIRGADVEHATDDAIASKDVGRFAVRPNAVLHGDYRGVRMQRRDGAACLRHILRFDRQQNDVGRPCQCRCRRKLNKP